MKWASALSEEAGFEKAFAEVSAGIRAQLEDAQPDLVLAFAAPLLAAATELPHRIRETWPNALLAGCSGAGVIGAGHEVEDRPALALVAACLPGVRLTPFHFDTLQLPADATAQAWRTLIGAPIEPAPHFLVIADPFTCDAEGLVRGLDHAYPLSKKFGGLASGGRSAGSHRLFLGPEVWRSGAVGVAMSGELRVETVVAQGCRPIGPPMLITRCRDNLLQELAGKPPIEALREVLAELPEAERAIVGQSLFVGLEMKKKVVEYQADELLVRNLVGIEPKTGALAVGAQLEPLQVLQFVVRDARTAAEDLTKLLKAYRAQAGAKRPAGALMFSCVGRGEHLFKKVDHDAGLFRELVGAVPLGGFFCNGEIGPVGGTTFLHGQTSSFALFSSPSP